jgi:hypothetical protein
MIPNRNFKLWVNWFIKSNQHSVVGLWKKSPSPCINSGSLSKILSIVTRALDEHRQSPTVTKFNSEA